MKNIFVLGLLVSALNSAAALAQTSPVAPSPIPSSLLPEDPFTTVTTRFSCADGQSLVITAKVPPRTLSVEFDDKRGIVAYRSEDIGAGGAAYDPFAAGIASERITARGPRDFSNLRVGSTTTSVSREDSDTQHWAKVEANRRAENRDRLLKAESRNAPTRKLTREELRGQRDAYEEMLENLERTQPIVVKHRYRSYSLMLERTYTGPKYVSRAQGIEWSVRNRLGALRSSFSGRLLASHCRQGGAVERAADLPAVTSTQ
jgi:hypothetical protein